MTQGRQDQAAGGRGDGVEEFSAQEAVQQIGQTLESLYSSGQQAGDSKSRLFAELLHAVEHTLDSSPAVSPEAVELMVNVINKGMPLLTDAQRAELNKSVANSLYQDESCRLRLERLWQEFQAQTS